MTSPLTMNHSGHIPSIPTLLGDLLEILGALRIFYFTQIIIIVIKQSIV